MAVRSISAPWLAMLLLATPAALADSPQDRFSDATTTLVVEIPVEVTLEGEPIRGLTAEDFEVFDDGDRVSIDGLDVVDLSLLQADETGRVDTRELPISARRHFLLLFDFSFASPAAIARAREAARELVQNDLHPADLVSVATYSLNSGARLMLGFTSDRRQVEVAIAGLGAPSSVQVRSDPLRLYVGTLEQGPRDDGAVQGSAGGERGNMLADQVRSLQQMADRARANQGRREVSAMTRSLSELAETLGRVDGRKHVVFFSEGFDSGLLLGATDQARRSEIVRRAQDNALWEVDSSEYFGSSETLGVLEDMAQSFRRADCTIHSVDVGGLRAGGELGGGGAGGKDGLFMMASRTGGSFYDNFNDLGEAMGQMLEKTSVTYVLRYRPESPKLDGRYRKLRVKTRGLPRKARISHRAGYRTPDAEALPSAAEMQLELAQRLLDGRSSGTIGVQALATPLHVAGDASAEAGSLGGLAYVPVLVEVEGGSFLEGGKESVVRAELFLYAMAADGSIADFFVQSVELDRRNVGEGLERRGFKVYAPLVLDRGVYDLRVLVRNAGTGRTGLVVSSFEVAAPSAEAPVLLPPLFPEATEEWILVRGKREELDPRFEPDYPFFHGSTTYVPAARPELSSGQGLPVFLAGYGLEGLDGLSSRLVGEGGAEVASPRWKMDPRVRVGEDGLERFIAAFEVPSVPAGDYVLELSLEKGEGASSTVGRLPVRILGPGEKGAHRLLALSTPVSFDDPEGSADLPGRAGPSMAEKAPEEELGMGDFEDAYRRALARLSAAGRATLVPELASLEQRALGEHPERRVARLGRAELRVAQRLAKRDPEVLVPLMLLHQDLFLEHQVRRRPHLELHSRQLVGQLADLYVQESGSEGSRVVAARALASLGGHLQADGRKASLGLFEQAVTLDPSNEAALLGLAAYYERRGGPYGSVVEPLRQLVERRPESREGRLRLAINLLRLAAEPGALGKGELVASARRYFESLVGEGSPDWIHSLAVQELARHHAREGRLGEAIAVLETALEARPSDQKLRLQLTFLLDRDSRSQQASRTAEVMIAASAEASDGSGGSEGGEASASTRGRYNRWPEGALMEDRRELASGARQRLAMLASTAGEGVRP